MFNVRQTVTKCLDIKPSHVGTNLQENKGEVQVRSRSDPQGPVLEVAGPGPLNRGPGQHSLTRTLGPACGSGPDLGPGGPRTGLRTVYLGLYLPLTQKRQA